MNVIEARRNPETAATVHMVADGDRTFLVYLTGEDHRANNHRHDWPDVGLAERIARHDRRDGNFSGAIRIA